MLNVVRYEKIIELLSQEGEVSVANLSSKLNVTGKTIRQDLDKLESKGLLHRTHGGAVLANEGYVGLFSKTSTNASHLDEKMQIAQCAVQFIESDDIIALDGGSTTLEIAKILKNDTLTIITNDLFIISELIQKDQIRLVVPGGTRNRNQLIGENPAHFYRQLRIQKAFISTTGIDPEHGLTIFTNMHVEHKRAVIESANQVFCVADHSKFNKSALLTFARLDEVKAIITDNSLSESVLGHYEQAGVSIRQLQQF